MNRIHQALANDKKLRSIYFTAGYPQLDDTMEILRSLQDHGADMVEIGLPFSDPLADGPTIQQSSATALANGMSTARLFEQLDNVRAHIHLPLLIMGYFNPILQYGVEAFCRQCSAIGIDGLIIPDLPLEEYLNNYAGIFSKYGLSNIFLITPQTSPERIRTIDSHSDAFIYMVSSASVTGSTSGFGDTQKDYFRRVAEMSLKTPRIVGFGINDRSSFEQATEYAHGAIIGSAFIKMLGKSGIQGIPDFMKEFKPVNGQPVDRM